MTEGSDVSTVNSEHRVASATCQEGPWHNRLAGARSPYLRQHADNPVDWYPWGADAFQAAIERDVPIFLSIGYAACHWCHVMERESFSDPRIGALLNSSFVSIKIDREEHPDVDAFFMDVLLRMNGEAGWPASLFLTPSRAPMQGGTYYPPFFRYGTPAFSDVLRGVRDGWAHNRAHMLARAEQLSDTLSAPPPQPEPAPLALVQQGIQRLLADYDDRYGGWGVGAKFPHPPRLQLLLETSGETPLRCVRHMLDAMDRGGIHDHVGGGFHRYAVDVEWEIPHFEKMLYDNAQLAGVYLRSWARCEERRYLTVGCETLEYLLDTLRDPDSGLLASSQDADDPDGEGAYYTWTAEELADVLGPSVARAVADAYRVRSYGNFEGRTVLNRDGDPSIMSAARRRLLAARRRRPAPAMDDKPVTAWNAMAAESLALGGRMVGDPRYTAAAEAILERLLRITPLRRVIGSPAPAVLDDHAALLSALLELHVASGDGRWLLEARKMGQVILDRFRDGDDLSLTAAGVVGLPVRRAQWNDHAEPAGSAWAVLGLMQLQALGAAIPPLDGILAAGSGWVSSHPDACPTLLRALSAFHKPLRTVVLTGEQDGPLWKTAQRLWLPQTLLIRQRPGSGLGVQFSALRGKEPGGPERAWICEGTRCQLPIREPERLRQALLQV